MPSIKSISCENNTIHIIDSVGNGFKFDTSNIPVTATDNAKLESYLNSTWLPGISKGDYQLQAHIISFSPLQIAIYAADINEKIPSNWWVPNQ